MRIKITATMTLLAILLAGCDNSDTVVDDDLVQLSIAVGDTDWQNEAVGVTVTRAGETIEGLKANGFSLHGQDLLGSTSVRRQVTWNSIKGQWDWGNNIYWKRTANGTFNVYAYAPYKTETFSVSADGVLTFKETDLDSKGKNIDLLYASAEVTRSEGVAKLTFRHAMTKVSFGTVTNNTGLDIELQRVDVKGTFNKSGNLNLTTGAWSILSSSDGTYSRIIDTDTADGDQPLKLSTGKMASIGIDPLLLIPNAPVSPATIGVLPVTITLTFDIGTFSFNVELEQGKDKTYNISVEKNFEVVIE